MKPTNIADDEHFVKHCKNKLLIREDGTGKPISVYPAAFHLRRPTKEHPEQEKTLSGLYFEFFKGTDWEVRHACCHFMPLELKPKDALVRMGSRAVKEQGKKRSKVLRVMYEPEPACLAYAAIRGLPVEPDDELCALLAAASIVEITELSTIS
jgi:hypothetical protein